MKTLIQNAKILFSGYEKEEAYDILIEDSTIAKIGKNLDTQGVQLLDANRNYVLPGFIDMHCDICDPGFEYIEDIETASQSAVRGGFTSITCQPNTNPVIDNKTVVEYVVSKGIDYSCVNIYPYGSMSIGCKGKDMAEIGEMNRAGIIGVSDGDEYVESAAFLRNILRYSRMFDMPVITHCEDKSLSGRGVMNDGFTASSLGLFGMPKEAEEVIVARNIILAEATGGRLHIAHVSTKGSVELIRSAKSKGVNITCETCPHYFLLTEEAVGNYNTLVKVNPPLRTQEDVNAIIEGIADGTIDVIASGHRPTNYSDKYTEFDNAAYGISSFETTFALSYTNLVETGIISIETLVEKLSLRPAQILGLKKKGVLAEGMDGDLIIVDTAQSYAIDANQFASKAKFSPFQGTVVKGRVLHAVVGGRVVL
ncbi:MAG: dihydroorotase [Epulopiscium sp.]|nr:dihydroorotase [Candidatus Epulonipiscium sp.]